MKWIVPDKNIKIIVDKEYVLENRPINMSMFAIIDKGQFRGLDIGRQEQTNVQHQGVANKAQPTDQVGSVIGFGYPSIQFGTIVDGKAVVAYEWIFEEVHERDSEFERVIKILVD
jgi:hypothetical protein